MIGTSHGSPRLNTVSISGNPWQVIAASAVGTMIEWYDFYICGSPAVTISPLFYPEGNNTLALIAYLSTFAVGFVVRPLVHSPARVHPGVLCDDGVWPNRGVPG